MFNRNFLWRLFGLVLLACELSYADRLAVNAERSEQKQAFGISAKSKVQVPRVEDKPGGIWRFSGFFLKEEDRLDAGMRTLSAGVAADFEWDSLWRFGAGYQSDRSEPVGDRASTFKLLFAYKVLKEDSDWLEFQFRPRFVFFDLAATGATESESYRSQGSELSLAWSFADDWKVTAALGRQQYYDSASGTSSLQTFRRTYSVRNSSSTLLSTEIESRVELLWLISPVYDLSVVGQKVKSDQSSESMQDLSMTAAAAWDIWDYSVGLGTAQLAADKSNYLTVEVGYSW